MQTVQRFDVYNIDDKTTNIEQTPEGYLKITGAILTRTGTFKYNHGNEYRPSDEVFAQSHLDSAEGKSITVKHPKVMVNKDNYKDYEVGTILRMYRKDDENYARGDLMVKDKESLRDLRELSLGYEVELVKQDGTDEEGNKYDYIQKNMKINHLAFVDKARAGSITRLNLDGEEYESIYNTTLSFANEKNTGLNQNIDSDMTIMNEEKLKTLEAENASLKDKMLQMQKKLDSVNGEKVALVDQVNELSKRIDGIEQKAKKDSIINTAKQIGIKVDEAMKEVNLDSISVRDLALRLIKATDYNNTFTNLDSASDEYILGVLGGMTRVNTRSDSVSEVSGVISNYSESRLDGISEFNKKVSNVF